MKRKLFTPLSMGAMALALVMVACGKAPQLTRDNVDDVLAHMTLDEKISPISHAKIAVISGTMKISLFDIVLLNFKCSDFR